MTHTSTEQPEALHLINWFEESNGFKQGTQATHKWVIQYEQELRRLHAENEKLREVLIDLIAGYEDTRCDGAMDMMVIGKDVQEAARILGITQEKQG